MGDLPTIATVFTATVVGLMRGSEVLEDRWLQQQIDEVRIELGAATARDLQGSGARAAGALIVPAIGDHIESVGDRCDARQKWNSSARESSWIAAAVPALMVRQDSGR